MYYYDPNNDKSNARRWASLAALLYALSIAAAFLFVSFDMGRDELLPGEGLLIDFGTTETGLGDRDLSATDVQAPPQQAAAEASRQQVEYVTSEREEIAVMYRGQPQMDVGPRTDVLSGCPKALAIPMALRAMNPQIIAVDEITVREDLRAISQAAGCGVALLATIHAANVEELQAKPLYQELMAGRVFRQAVLIRTGPEGRLYAVENLP